MAIRQNLQINIFLTLCFVILAAVVNPCLAQSEAYAELGQSFAKRSMNAIRNELPPNAKIALLLFGRSGSNGSTVKTSLGITLSEAFYQQLVLQNKKDYQLIFPEGATGKMLSDASGKYFEPPKNTEEEAKFWQSYLNGQKPDFFITGQYVLESNKVVIKNIFISSDVYSSNPKKISIENVEEDFDEKTMKEMFAQDIEIKPFSDPLIELLNLKGTGDFFSYTFLKGKEIKPKDEAFLINSEYCIELNVKKKTYVYAFFYQENDPESNVPLIIFPTPDKNSLKTESSAQFIMNPGKVIIPDPKLFSLSFTPPAGNLMIMLIATGQQLISFTAENSKDDDGITSKLNLQKSKTFLAALKALNPVDFQMEKHISEIK
jgi:hypothetical protein